MKKLVVNTISKGIADLAKDLPGVFEKAAGVAGLAIIDDSQNEDPTPPKDTGYLRGSWFVYANGQKKASGPDSGDTPGSIQNNSGSVTATVGFSAPYAAAQHQNLTPVGSWQLGPKSPPNAGGNFMAGKMDRNKNRYAQVFTDRVKKGIQESK